MIICISLSIISLSISNVADIACSTPGFATLCELVIMVGLEEPLTNDLLTVFAPTDEAFAALPEDLLAALLADVDLLRNVLWYHAVPNAEILVKDLICEGGSLDKLTMANNEDTSIACASSVSDSDPIPDVSTFIVGNGNTDTAGALIVMKDIIACNGVVQVIDEVLIPGAPAEPTAAPVAPVTPTAAPSFKTLEPTPNPTLSAPIAAPVVAPTLSPVAEIETVAPTAAPVVAPTAAPVVAPTAAPVVAPTPAPVVAPTEAPIAPTAAPISGPPVVLQAIQPVALQGGNEFADPNSYQSKALALTEEQEGIDAQTPTKIIQYYALHAIFMATSGVSNIITDAEGILNVPGWIVTAGWDSTTIDPCSGGWFGIDCENDIVIRLDLFSNLLTGAFPPEVTLLASDGERSTGAGALQRIDLFDNMLLTNNGDNSWWPQLGSDFGTFRFF